MSGRGRGTRSTWGDRSGGAHAAVDARGGPCSRPLCSRADRHAGGSGDGDAHPAWPEHGLHPHHVGRGLVPPRGHRGLPEPSATGGWQGDLHHGGLLPALPLGGAGRRCRAPGRTVRRRHRGGHLVRCVGDGVDRPAGREAGRSQGGGASGCPLLLLSGRHRVLPGLQRGAHVGGFSRLPLPAASSSVVLRRGGGGTDQRRQTDRHRAGRLLCLGRGGRGSPTAGVACARRTLGRSHRDARVLRLPPGSNR